jgi:hypothetical protein
MDGTSLWPPGAHSTRSKLHSIGPLGFSLCPRSRSESLACESILVLRFPNLTWCLLSYVRPRTRTLAAETLGRVIVRDQPIESTVITFGHGDSQSSKVSVPREQPIPETYVGFALNSLIRANLLHTARQRLSSWLTPTTSLGRSPIWSQDASPSRVASKLNSTMSRSRARAAGGR